MTTLRAAHAWAIGVFLAFATFTGGCYIEHGDGPDWDEDWFGEDAPMVGVCVDLCAHLESCNLISPEDHEACVDNCNIKHVTTPYLVETGCQCVLEAGCKPLDGYGCEGAPLPPFPPPPPPPGTEGAGGASSSGGPGDSCQADCDCASGAQCVGGTCKTPCTASCECATGESCVSGYCEAPPAPEITCQVDCDCPSGQVCNAGVCGSP